MKLDLQNESFHEQGQSHDHAFWPLGISWKFAIVFYF